MIQALSIDSVELVWFMFFAPVTVPVSRSIRAQEKNSPLKFTDTGASASVGGAGAVGAGAGTCSPPPRPPAPSPPESFAYAAGTSMTPPMRTATMASTKVTRGRMSGELQMSGRGDRRFRMGSARSPLGRGTVA